MPTADVDQRQTGWPLWGRRGKGEERDESEDNWITVTFCCYEFHTTFFNNRAGVRLHEILLKVHNIGRSTAKYCFHI